ncbi:MAG: oxidoreductase [Anaerolineae bacterium SM23_ 63]|nr:MAG: oxidoreductase [Anaerolineae bacterium SM23_ 63]HEY45986.1 aldo/keto reductase [Anaerolineae bacterium]
MQYANLGRTGLKVSRLCLGTMNFGPETSEPDSFAIMDKALDEGINFFDTANVYGWKIGEGITEGIIGRWLSQGGGRREKIVLATKVYGRMGEGPNERRLSAFHIRHACEESLRRLQTDRIDLYQMHHIDRETPWDEIWQAMEQLVREGKVLYVGSSNFAGLHIAQAQCAAASRNFLGLISEQSLYNLNARMIELEVIPTCRAYGLGLIPWSPLAGGMLGGALKKATEGRRTGEHTKEQIDKNIEQLKAYEALCEEYGEGPADVAMAWLLSNPDVTAPIIGPRTMEQLEGNLHALELELDDEILKKLDEIWPGPGGEAPEAYAW